MADPIILTDITREGIFLESNTMNVSSGGTAIGTTIDSHGYLNIFSSGTASNTAVSYWGFINVSSGGLAKETIINGGAMNVYLGGRANETAINKDGWMDISSGGIADGTTVREWGFILISSGGTATNITALQNGTFRIEVAPDTYVQGTCDDAPFEMKDAFISGFTTASCSLEILSGGKAVDTTIRSSAGMTISRGGIADGIIVDGAYLAVYSGGTATNIAADKSYYWRFTVAPDTWIQGTCDGSAFEIKDASLSGFTLNRGYLYVLSGGVADSITVRLNGTIYIESGGVINNAVIAVEEWGYYDGDMVISRGGVANSTTINPMGCVDVDSAIMNDVTVKSQGRLSVKKEAKLTGQVTFDSEAIVSMNSRAVLDFDLTRTYSGEAAIVNDLSIIQGTPLYSITVNGNLDDGTYRLAGGAEGFAQTISVVNPAGDELATITVGEAVSFSGMTCKLVLSGSALNLEVGEKYAYKGLTLRNGIKTAEKGKTFSNTQILSGGTLVVASGGKAESPSVAPGGSLYISSGGSAVGIVENGGIVEFENGAKVTFLPNEIRDLDLTGENATLHSGTTATNISFFGSLFVSSGAVANQVLDGKFMTVENGGKANVIAGVEDITIRNYGTANDISSAKKILLENNGTANNISGGIVTIAGGGVANNITGGEVTIQSGGIGSGISGGPVTVENGGSADRVTLAPNETLLISSGGRATNIIENGGYVDVQEGAKATFATNTFSGLILSYGNSATVHSGTKANNVTIERWGQLEVFSAGSANEITVNSKGTMLVSSAGKANGVSVNSGGTMLIASGGTVTNILWTPGIGSLDYENGAHVTFASRYSGIYYASDNKLLSQAQSISSERVRTKAALYVMSGGTANKTTVEGGSMYVSGGTAGDTTVKNGSFSILDGGIANSTTVSRVQITLSSGGTANVITLSDGASLSVDSGGSVNSAAVGSRSYLFVSSGATATSIRENGGFVDVQDGAAATFLPGIFENMTLFSSATVHSGTTARKITLYDKGVLLVFSGGTATSNSINASSGGIHVFSGGIAEYTMVSGSAALLVSGGTAAGTTVLSGGKAIVSGGTATETTLVSGGIMHVSEGGTATETTLVSGGIMHVSEGGTATNTHNSGTLFVFSGGSAVLTTLDSGGKLYVSKGGAVASTVISSGTAYVSNGTLADSVQVIQGQLRISSGGTANNVLLFSGGLLAVGSDGTATVLFNPWQGKDRVSSGIGASVTYLERDANVYYGCGSGLISKTDILKSETFAAGNSAIVYSGGLAESLTLGENCAIVLSGGSADGTTLKKGTMHVSSGGIVNSTTVVSSGMICVSSGGTATATVVSGGTMYVSSGGTAKTALVSGGGLYISEEGRVDKTVVDLNGTLHISGGGTAAATTVSRGKMVVDGTADGATIVSSGVCAVNDGGLADDVTIDSGGTLSLLAGGTAGHIAVLDKGRLAVSGGVANSVTVGKNGSAFIFSNGSVNGVSVTSLGRMVVSNGGKVTGQMTFETGAGVSAFSSAILDFDLTRTRAGVTAIVNDLSILQGTPLFTLTVSGNEANRIYKLADGAAAFNGTISVTNAAGDDLGTLAAGQTLRYGETDYKLNLTGSLLSVTVEGAPPMPPANLTGSQDRVSWEPVRSDRFVVEYSADGFGHAIRIEASSPAEDLLGLPAGTYQWRVKADGCDEWTVGKAFVSEPAPDNTPKVLRSNGDDCDDLFFAAAEGTWDGDCKAKHAGSVNDWAGTGERVSLKGKGRIRNLFFGSSDPNVLCLTDADNGDAIFVDDAYTDFPEEIEANTARLFRIREIRAGAGNDVVDMTSQKFEYMGGGLTIRGGDGNDTIWANRGGNFLFGDEGNDRIVGASGDDVIAGGTGNDRMYGGGGNDVFTFCGSWGTDIVEQRDGGSITLWFASGDESNWDAGTLTYVDGDSKVTVMGVSADRITLKFGDDGTEQYAALSGMGAFADFTSQRIFEDLGKGILAGQ